MSELIMSAGEFEKWWFTEGWPKHHRRAGYDFAMAVWLAALSRLSAAKREPL
jgi:hypothetical protein